MGCAQDGTACTVKVASSTIIGSTDIASSDMGYEVPGSDLAVPEISVFLPASISIGMISGIGNAGMNIESDSGEGVMDGFRRCSKAMSAGIACRDEPSLDSVSAALFSARGT